MPRLQRIIRSYLDLARARIARAAAERAVDITTGDVAPLGILFGYTAIARFLGVSRGQARSLLARGALPSFTLGGTVCCRRTTLRIWIEALEGQPLARDKGFRPRHSGPWTEQEQDGRLSGSERASSRRSG